MTCTVWLKQAKSGYTPPCSATERANSGPINPAAENTCRHVRAHCCSSPRKQPVKGHLSWIRSSWRSFPSAQCSPWHGASPRWPTPSFSTSSSEKVTEGYKNWATKFGSKLHVIFWATTFGSEANLKASAIFRNGTKWHGHDFFFCFLSTSA